MKKVLSLFLSVVMLLSITAGIDFSVFADDYIEIWNIEDLDNINLAMGEKYRLMADIDMTYDTAEGGAYNNNGWGWKPIGYDNAMTTCTEFTGEFDGNGHSLIGLNINFNRNLNSIREQFCGLFAINNGVIKNINLVDAYNNYSFDGSTGYYTYIGGICGQNLKEISNCSFGGTMNVKCTDRNYYVDYSKYTTPNCRCGGIAAENTENAKISNCFNTATLNVPRSYSSAVNSSVAYVAGISYDSYGEIKDCYNIGVINDSNDGYAISSYNCECCYNAGGAEYPVGSSDSNINIYAIKGTGKYYYKNNTTLLNETQSTMQSMYKGFDFKNTWVIDPNSTYKYPQLRDNRQDKIKTMETLEIVETPNKTTYYQNDLLDTTGGKLKVNYTTGETEYIDITEKMVTGFDSTKIGEQTLTVRFRNQTVTYNINVKTRPIISNVDLISMPDTTTFVKGTEFDFTGAVARITYAIGTSEDVELTTKNVTGYDINKIGMQTITYSVDDFSVSFDIEVIPVTVDKIEIVSIPDKTIYCDGEELDLTGLKVKATYNNRLTRVLDNDEFEVYGFGESIDKNTITLTYSGLSTSFDIMYHKPDGKWVTISDATCTVNGEKVQYCTECGEIAKSQVVSAFGHTEVVDVSINATCTKVGLTEGSHCSVCGAVIKEQKEIKAIGHKYISKVTNPTCKDKGYTTYTCSVCGDSYRTAYINVNDNHDYKTVITTPATCKTTGIKTSTCTVCGDTYTETIAMTNHTVVIDKAVAPTCTKTGKTQGSHCSVCGTVITAQSEVKATGHNYTAIVTEPTCKDKGYTTYTCTVCGINYSTDYTNANDNHDYKTAVTTPATCKTTGIKTSTCTVCGDTYTETIPMTEHTAVTDKAVEPTCTKSGLTEGSHCSVCGTVISEQKEIKATGHNYNMTVMEPTCKDKGYTIYTCSACGDNYNAEYVPTTNNHDYKSIVTTPATCKTTGVKTSTCTVCGDTYIETIAMTEHTVVTDKAAEPTCAKSGLTEGSHCAVCGEIIEAQKVINATGHKWNNGVITKPATCIENGVKIYTCTVCGETRAEQIAKTNHTVVIDKAVEPTCTLTGLTEGSHCSVCNTVLIEQKIIDKKPHTVVIDKAVEPTCTSTGLAEGSHCSVCNQILVKQEVIPEIPHNCEWINDNGHIVKKCTVCNNELLKLPFEDLYGYEYYGDYIAYTSVYNKFITGTNPPERTLFSPTTPITRAMFVTILYRMAGEPYANGKNPYTSSPFTDITNTGVYYYDAACWALKNGITTEITFKPFDNVTREQTASFLFRYAKDSGTLGDGAYKNVNLSSYPDYNDVHSWAVEPLQWANYNGMITGTQQGYINPQGATQRIHATKILYGFGKVCNIGNFA